uniref:Rapid alkalinization factor 1 n=1 Tax=Oryza punctata TaxID=4537 RepID=A0A0E0JIC0_ORYPU
MARPATVAAASALLLALLLAQAGAAAAAAGEVPLSWCCRGRATSATVRRDTTPCSVRGASYYNCQPGAQANPYSRGCSAITQCRG